MLGFLYFIISQKGLFVTFTIMSRWRHYDSVLSYFSSTSFACVVGQFSLRLLTHFPNFNRMFELFTSVFESHLVKISKLVAYYIGEVHLFTVVYPANGCS